MMISAGAPVLGLVGVPVGVPYDSIVFTRL